ncbi:hypothetical protein AVEN_267045-1, partial [Araneus ventricosus]
VKTELECGFFKRGRNVLHLTIHKLLYVLRNQTQWAWRGLSNIQPFPISVTPLQLEWVLPVRECGGPVDGKYVEGKLGYTLARCSTRGSE